MMASLEGWMIGLEPWTAPALDDLMPQLSLEEQLRLQSQLRKRERCQKKMLQSSFPYSEGDRDYLIIPCVRHALRHYNAKHQGDEFDAAKPLMQAQVRFRGQVWYHVNFWARSRKSRKIKRFFAEVHYKLPTRSSCSDPPPFPVTEAEKPPTSSSTCSHPPPFPIPVPIVEACLIIEESLKQYRRSCAFCRGHSDILHPLGRKFVCGNDKDRMVQQLVPLSFGCLKMPFTCPLRAAASNSQEEEEEKREF